MTEAYVQVRPVREDGEGRDLSLVRAFDGDTVFAWGLYATDEDGLPMHEEDYDTREEAISAARVKAAELGCSLCVDELDGTTSWPS